MDENATFILRPSGDDGGSPLEVFRLQGACGQARRAERPAAVVLRDVCFHWGDRPLLRKLDLEIPQGALAAVVGRSGSGKTTLRRLIQGELRPTCGTVVRPDSPTPQQVVAVAQEMGSQGGTVLAAIGGGRPIGDLGAAVELLERLGMLRWIEELPRGLLTPLKRLRGQLPAAARRQIALARGLLPDPELLLLDEPLLWLDAGMEQRLHRILKDRRQRGKTTILFTHRLGGTMQCDLIALLEGGRIAESGSHLDLMNRSGAYAGMWLDQLPIAAIEELVPVHPARW